MCISATNTTIRKSADSRGKYKWRVSQEKHVSLKQKTPPARNGLMIPILYIDRFRLLANQRFSDLEQSVIMCIF